MKKQFTNKDIKKKIIKNDITPIILGLLFLLFGSIYIFFLDFYAFLVMLVLLGIIVLALIVIILYKVIVYRNDNSWYISKEVITITKDKGDPDGPDVRVLLYDDNLVSFRGLKCYFGDIIYVIRKTSNNKPILMLLENEVDYIGDKEIVDNTNKYGKEYYLEKFSGKRIPVNKETHNTNEDGTKFKVSNYTIQENESMKKTIKYFIPLMIIVIATWLLFSFVDIKNMRDNWISTTATIEDREFNRRSDESDYKYSIVYEIDGVEYNSYIYTTYGSESDVGHQIKVYVNPKNYEKVRIDGWNVIK